MMIQKYFYFKFLKKNEKNSHQKGKDYDDMPHHLGRHLL